MLDTPPSIPLRCSDGANAEEFAVQAKYGCWRDLYLWVWQAYDLTDSTWSGNGLEDACNVTRPFAKVVNSVFLINYALSDNSNLQWHSSEDYVSSSRAADNRFHGHLYYQLSRINVLTKLATAETGRFLARDRTLLYCNLFNMGQASDSATVRASTLVHESWHHWQRHHGFVSAHPQVGSPSRDGDYYYFHRVGAYAFGDLDGYDTNPANMRFHSPYQIGVEFLADLAELSQAWVPLVVTQTARSSGNAILANRFKNSVAYLIGNPRPF